jgi:hypothetical protein
VIIAAIGAILRGDGPAFAPVDRSGCKHALIGGSGRDVMTTLTRTLAAGLLAIATLLSAAHAQDL